MKTKKIIPVSLFGTMLLGLMLTTSCKKENKADDTDTTSAADHEQSEFITNDAVNMTDNAAKGQGVYKMAPGDNSVYEPLSTCATITYDTTVTPHKLVIDFGTANCMCSDGRNRRGKIILTHNGNYFASGSVKTITFDGYYVNDNHVEGTKTVTNSGLDGNGNPTWAINVQNFKITRPDGKYHTWNSTRTRTMTKGYGTLTWMDDEYTISGTANGTNSNGAAYSATITTPLVRALACHWIQSGVIEFTHTNKPARSIDFGNGNCDNDAVVTINGTPHAIKLK